MKEKFKRPFEPKQPIGERSWEDPAPPSDWKPNYEITPRWVVCAALHKEGRTVTGARHNDKVMEQQIEATTEGLFWWRNAEKGFIDQFGDFMPRHEAIEHALAQGQIKEKPAGRYGLQSQHLYPSFPDMIVSAAMTKEGRIITGARHFDKIMRMQMRATEGLKWWQGCDQGFINQHGKFLSREDAWILAEPLGQIRREVSSPGYLFSENLY